MKKSNYTLLVVLVALTIINIFSDFLVEFIANVFGDDVKNNVSKETLLIIFAVFILFTLALIIFQYFHEKKSAELSSNNLTDNIEPDIKLLFDSLTERYKNRYESKLDGRFEITLEVNKDWNFNQPQTFKVNYRENTNIDEAFRTINESFNDKGRLLIVGSPGSGKTVLLLKLAIELLGNKCKADQKLPVIFNLASWSPDYAKFDDWLIDVLNAGNGLSKDFARTLLQEKRIIFLLDGLDELARNEAVESAIDKRAKCLDSLNDYLRMGRKAVICCRREEFAAMQTATNQAAPVSAKVEVLDLGKPEIVLALQHTQQDTKSNASATNLLKIIETNDVFLDVLATPFYFTTALEVFDSEILKDKDFPTEEEGIKKYLLDRFIESKLKHANKLTEFEKDKAKILKWLSWLAKLMEKKQLVSFELADLQPNDLIKTWYFGAFWGAFGGLLLGLIINLAVGLFGSSIFEVINEPIGGEFDGLLGSLLFDLFGMFFGCLVGGIYFVVFNNRLSKVVNFDRVITEDILKIDFSTGSIIRISILGVLCSFSFGFIGDLFFGLIGGIVFTVIFWLLSIKIITKTYKFTQLQTSYQRLFGGTSFNISILFLTSLIIVVPPFLFKDYMTLNDKMKLGDFLLLLLALIVFIFDTAVFRHSILRIALFFEGSTPLKYATFLDLAAEARILEKDGGHWRFRHQTLQEHFAKLDV